MRPTPRKLALLMSIAGFGASLGEAAQARTDVGVQARPMAVVGLSSAARQQGFATAGFRDAGFGPALSMPLDGSFGDADKAAHAAAPAFAHPETDAALSSADGRDAAVPALAGLQEARPQPRVAPVADVVAGESSGTPTAPQEPAEHWVVNGIRVRPPKGPPISTKPWESIGAAGDGPDKASAPEDEAQAAAQPTAALASPAPSLRADLAASIAGGALATPAEEASAYLAFHLQTFATPSAPALVDALHDAVDGVRRDATTDVDLHLDLDLHQARAVDANVHTAAGLDLNLDEPQSVDLDLDLDRNLSAALYAGVRTVTASAAAPVSRLDAGTQARTDSVSHADTQPSVARATAMPRPAPHPIASPMADSPELAFGTHAERVMRSLHVLLSAPGLASDVFGAQTDPVFVATHAEKAVQPPPRPAPRPRQTVDEAAFEMPPRPAEQALSALTPAPSPLGEALAAISESSLDEVRGGFTTDTGIQMSFGIDRAVFINGDRVSGTNISITDAGKVVVTQLPDTAGVGAGSGNAGNLTLIQNGAGNTFLSGPVSASNLGTVIQNTLNDQKIQNVTSINATVNSLQLLRAQNFESSLRGAIVDSLRR